VSPNGTRGRTILRPAFQTLELLETNTPSITRKKMSTSPLGLLIPGRPITTAFIRTSETQYLITIHNPGEVSELAVFLVPGETIPPNTGLAFWWSAPPYSDWFALGTTKTNAPSGIFRTGWSTTPAIASLPEVRLGVSLETSEVVTNLGGAVSSGADKGLAQLLAEDLANCLGSFSQNVQGVGERLILPADVLQSWLRRISEKTRLDPNFTFLKKV